ncbi:HNH/endonuclease VII fold putative polymorphic toxin [Burkholderia dolosa]|uniref:HNH/endonuclease VII fold putative polymorphic toxin n=1 Tax=Burkholderia dolosa TaxID=152500 RepID=UPI0034558004
MSRCLVTLGSTTHHFVIILSHSAGHCCNQSGVGDQPPHHNVRREENSRAVKVGGMDDLYYFNCRNRK